MIVEKELNTQGRKCETRLIPDGVGRPSCDRLPSDPDDGRRGEGGQLSGATRCCMFFYGDDGIMSFALALHLNSKYIFFSF